MKIAMSMTAKAPLVYEVIEARLDSVAVADAPVADALPVAEADSDPDAEAVVGDDAPEV